MTSKIIVGDFENFIIETSRAKTADDLYALLSKSMTNIGYDQILFTVLSDRDLTSEGLSLATYNTYPEDWQKYYAEKRFDKIDPVIKCFMASSLPFQWDDIQNHVSLNQKQLSILDQGREAGLNNGVALAFRGSKSQLAGIGLASTQKIDACEQRLDLINAYCQQFFIAYKRMFLNDASHQKLIGEALSPQETNILTWAAAGKTDEDIADILAISRHTVDTHMRRIFQKLDANNRIQAVVKAITMGMISP